MPDYATACASLAATIEQWEGGRDAVEVLEAGGGSLTHIPFRALPRVTVVDISPEQLERNEVAERKILGDLHELDLGDGVYDAAICYDVIEHLADPARVVAKLFRAVKPGGIVVLAAPNPSSLSGRITKLTPHWFHVFVLRHVFGNRTAGLPGYPPFPTVHHKDIRPERLLAAAERAGMERLLFCAYESPRRAYLRERSPSVGRLFDLAIRTGNLLVSSPLEASDMFFVVRRPAAPAG